MNHIALFLPSLRGGGAERVMLALANGFAARGCKVDLILAQAKGPYLKDVDDAVRIIDLRVNRVIKCLPGLAAYLRRERPQAMVSALGHANVVALWARRISCVPVRVVVSEHSNFTISRANTRSIRERCKGYLMRWVYPHADAVVAVSQGVANDLATALGLARSRIHVVYNPVVTSDLYDKAAEGVKHPWFGPDQPPVILAVGRLTAPKDFPTLIRAFAQVRAIRKCHLVILGDGECRGPLESLIAQLGLIADVQMPGFQANPYAWMRNASLFVLSSAWEGLPTVLIEAMACGTSVVSTDCPSGPAEILENGKWGRLVPVGDVDRLAVAMLATLSETTKADVAKRAQDFDVEQAVSGYWGIIRSQL